MALYIPRAYVLRIRASMIYRDDKFDGVPMWSVVHIGKFATMMAAVEWRQEFQIAQRDYRIRSRLRIFDVWPTRATSIDFDPNKEDGDPDAVADALTIIIPSDHVRREEDRLGQKVAHWSQYR